ncbi:Uncharacterised protein [Campylobacter hyointestinalis subsp. hyointestinalis]|uniref:Uncharacterized protein n=1 Tax=Campylobacter hyointestinalis subsp. hyointestinalis TaxID=91352 RepID=A0A0S4RAE2_CAMHY|nr:hypothetical protein [Campylobacter hyointestinalis]PPB63091.1 hypothetical protein CDQ72_01455 [Campylobacter hyointestinalis subsp. hyointestinalis]PPB65361.1 hypothetical protein CDQ73_01205 [Campylobacter hyointestinalis subsp. hyointestinalis]CUU71048.1 Uncharacterised protein [Campylobacter hyointestinalis subsp. hyointestinalis]CUU72278.1 Uncharacterised protein [Campylobacter hyointestinalis subsp. hyointestinalis]
MIYQTKVIKPKIPNELLEVPQIDINRTFETNTDISIFMLDVYEAYEKCKINLKGVSKYNE